MGPSDSAQSPEHPDPTITLAAAMEVEQHGEWVANWLKRMVYGVHRAGQVC